MIYIREAHPVDGWRFGHGVVGKVIKFYSPLTSLDTHDPKTMEERRSAANQCQGALQYGIKTYVDDMDDTVSKAYAAKPTRLYLIGLNGQVVYAGGPGPYGFKPDELKTAIEANI